MRESARGMQEQLLNQLQSKLSLPACLKTVGYLRRLYKLQWAADGAEAGGSGRAIMSAEAAAVVETRLRREFLQRRDAWHSAELTSVRAQSPAAYVSGMPAGRCNACTVQASLTLPAPPVDKGD